MKKTAAVLLFITLVLTSAIASLAQQRPGRVIAPPVAVDGFAEFGQIDAMTDNQGAFIRWTMVAEQGNAGFQVYRLVNGTEELVNELVIVGSVAKAGDGPLNGETYDLYDLNGSLGTIYVIRAISSYGPSFRTQPFTPRLVGSLEKELGRTRESLIASALHPNGRIESRGLELTDELQQIVQASVLVPNPTVHQWVMSQPGVKISVRKDGLYRITRQQLQDGGFNVSSDPANWRLFLEGNEQAIIVSAGGEYIEFMGRGIDIRETDLRIYNLIADTTPGSRIATKVLRSIGGNVISNNYRATFKKKERTSIYIARHINGEEENFWGRLILLDPPSPGNEIPFTVNGIDTSLPRAVLTIRLQGIQGISHYVRAVLNGHEIGHIGGGSNTNYSQEFLVPTNYLVEGTNLLALNETQPGRSSLFDTVSVRLSRKYQADQNAISFYTPGYRKADLTGFTTSDIRLFDTTLDGNPVEVTNLNIEPNGSTFTVKLPSSRPMVMYGLTQSAALEAVAITANVPSTLSSPDNAADLIIISDASPQMMAASELWANYRRSREGGGVTVKVVSITDVTDEFGYCLHKASSINEFLRYAKDNWTTPPRYVLLIGDASFDPKNYLGFGYLDFLPTRFVDLLFEESGSDEALADFDHNGLADIPIGRIAVRTPGDVATALSKTMAFETTAMQSLDRGALCAFDVSQGFDFEGMCVSLLNELPSGVPKTFVSKIEPNAQANLIAGLNTGKYIVNYAGHGGTGLWATTNFFSINNVPQLTNDPSIFTMLTCFNGTFFLPAADSLGEALIKHPTGGAVATWASTTETTADVQFEMGARFYNRIGVGDIKRIGDLITYAKLSIAGSDVGYSWSLLGDPMLQVRSGAANKPTQMFSAGAE